MYINVRAQIFGMTSLSDRLDIETRSHGLKLNVISFPAISYLTLDKSIVGMMN